MRIRFSVIFALVWIVMIPPAAAQETPVSSAPLPAGARVTLSKLSVSLWAEYDRPEMLVIYRAQLAPDTPLPAAIEFAIPAEVERPHAVAYLDAGGSPFTQPYTTRVDGRWRMVVFDLSAPGFQIEYYAPLAAQGDRRTFAFTYPGDYAVTALSLDVLVPPGAQDFALEPPAGSSIVGDDGLTYQVLEAGPLSAGEERTWTVAYSRTGGGLAATAAAASQATAAPSAPAARSGDGSTALIFLLAFLALAAVGVGAFWLGRRVQPAGQGVGGSRHEGRGSSKRGALDDVLYCPECGARLRPDADFCHRCGTPVSGR